MNKGSISKKKKYRNVLVQWTAQILPTKLKHKDMFIKNLASTSRSSLRSVY